MLANEQAVSLETLIPEVQKQFDAGMRLVGISVAQVKETNTFDLLYTFDKELSLQHLRLNFACEAPVQSVSGVYFPALLYENEIKDQFGVNFQNILIDFGGALYLEQEVMKSPYCSYTIAKKGKEEA